MVFSFRIPIRFLRGNYTRLTLTIIALAFGVALVCAIDLVNRAVFRSFVEIIDTMAGRAALQIRAEDGALFSEDTAAAVGKVAGVELAVPVVVATAFTTDLPSESIAVYGVDVANDAAVRVYAAEGEKTPELEDPLTFLNQPDSIILTADLARRRGLSVGGSMLLDTATGRREFTVRGLLEPRGIARAFGGSLAVMDLYAAEANFARPGFINQIDIVVAPDANLQSVADAIAAAVPAGLKVETPLQRKADLQSMMRSLQVLLQALGLIGLAAAFLIAFNRLSLVYEERVWQLAVLRGVGVRRRAVWRDLVKESFIVGVMGVVVGIPLGIAIGRLFLPVIAATTALNYRLVAPDAALHISATSLLLATLLGLGAALSSALLPAWRVSGLNVAEILRARGIEQPDSWAASGSLARVALLAGIAITVILQFVSREPIWGFIATAMLVVGTKVAARPLLRFVGLPIVSRLPAILGPSGRFLSMSMSRNPRRTGLTLATIGIGLGAVVWLGVVARSFEVTALQVFDQAMRADLVVSSAHIGGGELEMPVDDRFAAVLQTVDGVDSVIGVRLTNWRYEDGPIVLDTFDPAYFRNPVYGQWPLMGERLGDTWEAVASGTAVVVSSNFAQNLGVRVGDHITLATPAGPLTLAVGGITTDFASPRGTIEMSRAVYARYWNDTTVTRFFVDAKDGADLTALRAAVQQKLAAQGGAWRIISARELVDYWGSQVRRAFAPIYVLACVILAVILFGIIDNLSASVAEQTREVGIVRAIGVRRRVMWRWVVAEAVVVSMLGLLLAVGEGFLVGWLWVQATIPAVLGWVIDLHVPWALIIVILVVTILSSAAAALVPGRKASRLEPAVALRWE